MMQQDNHIFQGLRRDNHQIRQKPEYLWDAHNIRLTNRDDSTLLSITNERGPEDTGISFDGQYVGHCVLNKYLVVFTCEKVTDEEDEINIYRIYRVEYEDQLVSNVIFEYADRNSEWGRGWTPEHPIETLGYYETDLIHKVYWIDDVNQPRVINITKKELTGSDSFEGLYDKDSFDFVRKLKLEETVDVEKIYTYGEFSPGTIQYALSYYDKYGQESNIFYTTPLFYISHTGRAGNGEDKICNSFKITITNPDDFDCVRIYSIHRTSIDAVPTVKIVGDIDIKGTKTNDKVSFIDTGIKGDITDNTQLLYVGGRGIIARTMAQKDGTLFFGNVTHTNNFSKEIEDIILYSDHELEDVDIEDFIAPLHNNVYYDYTPSLDKYNARFKTNETYRLGIQAQLSDGSWTDPIHIGDSVLSDRYRWETPNTSTSKGFKILKGDDETRESLKKLGVVKLRSCIVFPTSNEREILCQGILSPTVYFKSDRKYSDLFNVSSWFFRPILHDKKTGQKAILGSNIEFNHDTRISTDNNSGGEIQGDSGDNGTSFETKEAYIDENILTFHSPDIEFDTNAQNFIWDNTYLNIVGVAPLEAISGDIKIELKQGSYSTLGGVNTHMQGYTTGTDTLINGGLVSGLFYKDELVPSDYSLPSNVSDDLKYFPVYPWHRSGSLNNDSRRPSDKGERTAVLGKKVISNLKFFNNNRPVRPIYYTEDNINSDTRYDISTPQLFMSNELTLLKFQPVYLNQAVGYMGNLDKLLTSGYYDIHISDTDTSVTYSVIANSNKIHTSNDPVRIKYKSTPHLMFSLKGKNKEAPLLPRLTTTEKEGRYTKETQIGDIKANYKTDRYTLNDIDGTLAYILKGYFKLPEESSELGDDTFSIMERGTPVSGRPSHGQTVYLYLCKGNDNSRPINVDKSTFRLKVEPGITKFPHYVESDVQRLVLKLRSVFKDSEFNDSGDYIGDTRFLELSFDKESNTILSITDITSLVRTSTEDDDSEETYIQTRDYFTLDGEVSVIKPYVWIADICRGGVLDKFGGNTPEALLANQWLPAGEPVPITDEDIIVPFLYGDTWYARYDCLKTYPFTREDENQVVEIGSFLCETRVNLDGRWDRNRGKLSNLDMSPENFNLMNEAYYQRDNFFTYRKFDEDFYKQLTFSNQVIWSKTKIQGNEIDVWSNVTLANSLDFDGSKGKVTALETFNDNLLCLQDEALSHILFNSRVQIQASDGVPIEIANSGKVDGYRTISNSIGCQNKWSVVDTPNGVMFTDNYTDTIWNFDGKLNNLSELGGTKWWIKENHSSNEWRPYSTENNNIRTFYDSSYNDVYFTPGLDTNSVNDALCYSFILGGFMSQFSYGGTQAMFNFNDKFMSLRHTNDGLKLYTNFKGDYNNFFGEIKGWNFSFISNDNPLMTKVFDTVELTTDHWNNEGLLNTFPVNYIEVSNEYQNGYATFDSINMRKKFRIWRCLIPRKDSTRQRIRNPWSMVKLGWDPLLSDGDNQNNKAMIHDVSVKYTI